MGRRSHVNNYYTPGIYHITVTLADRRTQVMGTIVGSLDKPDGDVEAPHVELSAVGRMVEQELTTSIHAHYRMVEVQDYVVMPDHLHFIVMVRSRIVSASGRLTHLGQVIAGFKKGCNRRYWEIMGMQAGDGRLGEPADADASAASRFVVCPQRKRVPSSGSSGRPPLFSNGYVDVMPLREGQLEQQRAYIRNNPRYRLLRMANRDRMQARRGYINTLLTFPALWGYLRRECKGNTFDEGKQAMLQQRLIEERMMVGCDSYGDRQLLERRLLPVVCHGKDSKLFSKQKARCLAAARDGAVLVSARIANGEQTIIDEAIAEGYAVVIVMDNGIPEIFHPSEQKEELCAAGRMLMVTPWHYHYRPADETISVAECKTMNCVAQALCRKRDDWWKGG